MCLIPLFGDFFLAEIGYYHLTLQWLILPDPNTAVAARLRRMHVGFFIDLSIEKSTKDVAGCSFDGNEETKKIAMFAFHVFSIRLLFDA